MKITIYNQLEIPSSTNTDFWIHYIYCDSSGWVSLQYEDEDEDIPIETCREIIKVMELEASKKNGIRECEALAFAREHNYFHNNINDLQIVEAVPYRGETTTFIWSY
ncbi:MAG: hypothetical protein DRI65_18140 [Chloroflexota bacterium]|nr:MAG: hypothetical protein DRI65_18140 [Chloroflexota bacterium]